MVLFAEILAGGHILVTTMGIYNCFFFYFSYVSRCLGIFANISNVQIVKQLSVWDVYQQLWVCLIFFPIDFGVIRNKHVS